MVWSTTWQASLWIDCQSLKMLHVQRYCLFSFWMREWTECYLSSVLILTVHIFFSSHDVKISATLWSLCAATVACSSMHHVIRSYVSSAALILLSFSIRSLMNVRKRVHEKTPLWRTPCRSSTCMLLCFFIILLNSRCFKDCPSVWRTLHYQCFKAVVCTASCSINVMYIWAVFGVVNKQHL